MIEGKTSKPAPENKTSSAYSSFSALFSEYMTSAEGYTATAQLGRPLKRIRRIKRTLFCALPSAFGMGEDP